MVARVEKQFRVRVNLDDDSLISIVVEANDQVQAAFIAGMKITTTYLSAGQTAVVLDVMVEEVE